MIAYVRLYPINPETVSSTENSWKEGLHLRRIPLFIPSLSLDTLNFGPGFFINSISLYKLETQRL